MKQRKTMGWLTIGVMVVVLAISVVPVLAREGMTATTAVPLAHGGFGGRGTCGQAGLDAAAKALKMTTEELTAQLWGGQTLSGLAEKAGVEIAAVQSAVQAACQQAQIDAINQAVKDGKITQANADWLIEGIEKGYIGGNGGFGFGGFGMLGHGRGHGFGFGVPKGTAPNSPTPNGTTSPSRLVF